MATSSPTPARKIGSDSYSNSSLQPSSKLLTEPEVGVIRIKMLSLLELPIVTRLTLCEYSIGYILQPIRLANEH